MAPHDDKSKNKEIEIEIKPKKSENMDKKDNKLNFSETFDSLKKNANVDTFVNYAKNNTQDTIAYGLMIFGMIWALFVPFFGEILVGLVAGFYFSKEILYIIRNYNEFMEIQGTERSWIFAGTLLVLFISAPGIFIGAAVASGIKWFLRADR